MGCCGGGGAPAKHEPYAVCDGSERHYMGDAWVIARKFGLDPCSVTGTGRGGIVTRQDVDRALGRT